MLESPLFRTIVKNYNFNSLLPFQKVDYNSVSCVLSGVYYQDVSD